MGLIGIFVALVAAFMIIGVVAAIAQKNDNEEEENASVVISQEVPSAFDAFKGNSKRK